MRNLMSVGICRLSRRELESLRGQGQRLALRVVGVLVVAGDVPPQLAGDVIARLSLRGVIVASPGVRRVLESRRGCAAT